MPVALQVSTTRCFIKDFVLVILARPAVPACSCSFRHVPSVRSSAYTVEEIFCTLTPKSFALSFWSEVQLPRKVLAAFLLSYFEFAEAMSDLEIRQLGTVAYFCCVLVGRSRIRFP